MKLLKRSNLKLRLFVIVFTSTVLIGSFTVWLMFFITYRNELLDSEQQINQLMDAVEYSAVIAGYSSNSEIAHDVINGLMRSDNVCQARLYNKAGLDVTSAKYASTDSCSDVITRTLRSPFDSKEIIGYM